MSDFQCALRGSMPGEIWQSSFSATTGTTTTAQAVANELASADDVLFVAGFLGNFSTEIGFTSWHVTRLAFSTGVADQAADSNIGVGGGSAGPPLPNQIAPVISLRTASLSRGRMYLPTVTQAATTTFDGRLTTTARGNLLTFMANFFDALRASIVLPITPVVWRRPVGGAGGLSSPVVSIDVGDVLDTQRRRRNKLVEARVSRTLV